MMTTRGRRRSVIQAAGAGVGAGADDAGDVTAWRGSS
jgi:hypothetical protein